jgi:hypothetical protein
MGLLLPLAAGADAGADADAGAGAGHWRWRWGLPFPPPPHSSLKPIKRMSDPQTREGGGGEFAALFPWAGAALLLAAAGCCRRQRMADTIRPGWDVCASMTGADYSYRKALLLPCYLTTPHTTAFFPPSVVAFSHPVPTEPRRRLVSALRGERQRFQQQQQQHHHHHHHHSPAFALTKTERSYWGALGRLVSAAPFALALLRRKKRWAAVLSAFCTVLYEHCALC